MPTDAKQEPVLTRELAEPGSPVGASTRSNAGKRHGACLPGVVSAAMRASKRLLAASLTAVLLVGGAATACGDDGEEGDMGDMEMNEEEE